MQTGPIGGYGGQSNLYQGAPMGQPQLAQQQPILMPQQPLMQQVPAQQEQQIGFDESMYHSLDGDEKRNYLGSILYTRISGQYPKYLPHFKQPGMPHYLLEYYWTSQSQK